MRELGAVRRILHEKYAELDDLHPQQVCAACVEGLGVRGAALTLVASSTGTRMGPTLAASDPTIAMIEELQFTLGEGPALMAFTSGEPVLMEDIQEVSYTPWPAFTTTVRERAPDLGALFAFPLHVGALRLGVLSLCRTDPGRIGPKVLAEALLASEAIALILVGYVPTEPPTSFADRWSERAAEQRIAVYQATGMLMSELGVGASAAFVLLRARAYATDTSVNEIAGEVLSGHLTFEED